VGKNNWFGLQRNNANSFVSFPNIIKHKTYKDKVFERNVNMFTFYSGTAVHIIYYSIVFVVLLKIFLYVEVVWSL